MFKMFDLDIYFNIQVQMNKILNFFNLWANILMQYIYYKKYSKALNEFVNIFCIQLKKFTEFKHNLLISVYFLSGIPEHKNGIFE